MSKIIVEIDSMLEELIPEYLDHRKKEMIELNELLNQNDLATIEKVAHKMAGNFGSYGFNEMGEKAKEIELLCPKGETEKIGQLLKEIQFYLDHLEVKFI